MRVGTPPVEKQVEHQSHEGDLLHADADTAVGAIGVHTHPVNLLIGTGDVSIFQRLADVGGGW